MCKIRLITKDKCDHITSDEQVEVHKVELNVIDNPAYVVHETNDMEELTFYFPNSSESTNTYTSAGGRFSVNYGSLSGRIYNFHYNSRNLTDDERKFIRRNLVRGENTLRFRTNVESFMILIQDIIKTIKRGNKKNDEVMPTDTISAS